MQYYYWDPTGLSFIASRDIGEIYPHFLLCLRGGSQCWYAPGRASVDPEWGCTFDIEGYWGVYADRLSIMKICTEPS